MMIKRLWKTAGIAAASTGHIEGFGGARFVGCQTAVSGGTNHSRFGDRVPSFGQ